MRNQISVYELPLQCGFTLPLHRGSKLIMVTTEYPKAYLWVLEPPDTPITQINFFVIYSKEEIELPPTCRYVDTFSIGYGRSVADLWVDTAESNQVDGNITKLNKQSFQIAMPYGK